MVRPNCGRNYNEYCLINQLSEDFTREFYARHFDGLLTDVTQCRIDNEPSEDCARRVSQAQCECARNAPIYTRFDGNVTDAYVPCAWGDEPARADVARRVNKV